MSRQVRHRVTGLVLGGFLLGAAVVTTGTANAEQIEGAGRQVVFGGGGMLGLACESTPSIESMTVPAESTVRVVNRTGYSAKLLLDGSSKGTVPDDGVTEVVFRRGTTAVTLDPNCPVTDQATPVLVTASPSAPSLPLPDPEPTGDDDADEVPAASSGPDTPPASSDGDGAPGAGAPTAGPQRPAAEGRPAAPRPATRGQTAITRRAVPALPQGGVAHPQIKTKIHPGTATAGVPALPGMPAVPPVAAASGAPVPSSVEVSAPGAVPAASEAVPAVEAVPATEAGPVREVAAAEPVAAVRPLPQSRPAGLLVMIAAVFAAGVGAAAIRAFVSQRASRANVA